MCGHLLVPGSNSTELQFIPTRAQKHPRVIFSEYELDVFPNFYIKHVSVQIVYVSFFSAENSNNGIYKLLTFLCSTAAVVFCSFQDENDPLQSNLHLPLFSSLLFSSSLLVWLHFSDASADQGCLMSG
jgi:hypothetical protein